MRISAPVAPPHHSYADDDRTLIHRIADGDQLAFERLYRRYAPRLAGYLTPWLENHDVVDEVLNEVLLAVWQHAARFAGTAKPSTWILGIARNKARMARRSAAAAAPPLGSAADMGEGDPEFLLRHRERRRLVQTALATLSPEDRDLVLRVYEQQQSYVAIAAELGCPVNTLKSRLRRIRQGLMPTLEALGMAPQRRAPQGRGRKRNRPRCEPDHTTPHLDGATNWVTTALTAVA